MEFDTERGTGKLYWIKDGEYLEIGRGITPLTATLETENGTTSFPIELERNAELSVSFTMNANSEAQWFKFLFMHQMANKRCRSRKRFVKLSMGLTIDRNSANELADIIRQNGNGMSWQTAWRELCMELAV